jgi:hypothetical protein
MSWKQNWQAVLDIEMKRWSGLSCEQLVAQLSEAQSYEIVVGPNKYQVEVELLENTEEYLHVMVAVDDGVLPRSIAPLTNSFILQK